MATRAQKQERERRVVSAEQRLTDVATGGRTCYDIPKGVSIFMPKKVATYPLEIIPFVAGETNRNPGDYIFMLEVWTHFGVGPGNEAVLCPAKMISKPCPICEHRMSLGSEAQATEQTKLLIKALLPKRRELWNIYNHDEPEKGVQIWDVSFHNFGKFLYGKIQRATNIDKAKYMKFADPDEGMTVLAGAMEKDMGSGKYLEFNDIEFRPRKEMLADKILDAAVCLDDILVIQSYSEIRAKLHQTPEEDEAQVEAPARRSRSADPEPAAEEAPRRRRAAPEPEPEPEPAPRRGGRIQEPEPPAEEELQVGDAVSFEYKGTVYEGDIINIDEERGIYQVECDGRDKPFNISFDDETLQYEEPKPAARRAPEPEPEPSPAPRGRRAAAPAADPEPEPAPRRGRRVTEPEPEPELPTRGRRAAPAPADDEGWDDGPAPAAAPARGRRAAPPADDEPEPPAPRGRRAAAAPADDPPLEDTGPPPRRARR